MNLAQVTARLLALVPRAWFSDVALTIGGNFYALMNAIATAQQALSAMIDYTRLQTRIATATDTNLEAIALDYLGPGHGRFELLSGTNLVPETDPQYSTRIRAEIVQTQDTIASIQYIVQNYINTAYTEEYVSNIELLGLDAVGSLDGRGALDGRPKSTPALPQVYVFDTQSDPVNAAAVGLDVTKGQFCITFIYGGLAHDGFFLGYTYIGQGSHLLTPKIQVVEALTSTLDAIVNACRAVGTQQVYADNRSA